MRYQLKFWTFIIIVVVFITVLAGVSLGYGLHPAAAAAGLILMFFLPGFLLSFLIVPPEDRSVVLRFVLSVSFSLAIEPTTLFLFGYIGLPITLLSSIAIAISLTAVGGFLVFFQRRRRRMRQSQNV